MGKRGPIPKRSEERRRRNKQPEVERVPMTGEVRPPPLPRSTHRIARRWYRSLRESGQSQFYEPSDWAAALFVAEAMTRMLKPSVWLDDDGEPHTSATSIKGFATIWGAMKDLLTTESARRRAQIEVVRGGAEPDEDAPTALDDYRKRMEAR